MMVIEVTKNHAADKKSQSNQNQKSKPNDKKAKPTLNPDDEEDFYEDIIWNADKSSNKA